MDTINKTDIETLIKDQRPPCISIYMPTHPTAAETDQDRIRFKNLVRIATEKLTQLTGNKNESQALLQPAQELLQEGMFWRYLNKGLALFCGPETFTNYRLPIAVNEQVIVAGHFHVKPMLPLLCEAGWFYVLALSQNRVRLLHCTREREQEIVMEDTPQSLNDALRYDESEKQLQFHTGSPSDGDKRPGMFHGHGVGKDDKKEGLERYMRAVAQGVDHAIENLTEPLVLAGTDPLISIYRHINGYAHVLEEEISGNPDEMSEKALREAAWKIVAPHFRTARDNALTTYKEMPDRTRTASDIEKVITLAFQGRVDLLFVAEGINLWGRFDPNTGELIRHEEEQPGDEDLLSLAALYTIAKGGTVHPLSTDRLPEDSPVAALLRF